MGQYNSELVDLAVARLAVGGTPHFSMTPASFCDPERDELPRSCWPHRSHAHR
jgi:hypothetical protein